MKLAVVTSFSVTGITNALENWPKGIDFAELYCFMQADTKHFLLPHSGIAGSAIDQMARLKKLSDGPSDVIEAIAMKISKLCGSKKIVAFATFLPEISCEDNNRVQQAQRALSFLLRLAHILNKQYFHEIRAIELVAGSLIGSIDRVDGTIYTASITDKAEALHRLCKNLRPIAHECGVGPKRICLAVEMEPGPLYVLGNWDQMNHLNELLDNKYKDLSHCVGFNLDIPHWAILSKIQPEEVRASRIIDRVVHAHISDHDKGHFCDNVLHFENPKRPPHGKEIFAPWIELLQERAQEGDVSDKPRFSNAVSYELEACKSPEAVEEACRRARKLFQELNLAELGASSTAQYKYSRRMQPRSISERVNPT